MTRPLPVSDFRAVRHVLEPQDFALGSEEDDPAPSDQIDPETWAGIMHLPDDVAIRTSDHCGRHLRLLYCLWADWIVATGDPENPDELFDCMLDANDCLQAANFDLLHGFYRSSVANLRAAFELAMIGTFGNLRPHEKKFVQWKKGDGDLRFSYCRTQLFNIFNGKEIGWVFTKEAFPNVTYGELCKFTHARPDSTDAALWKSNGPVYDRDAVLGSFRLLLDVYAISYLLVKIGRPSFVLPEDSSILFELDWITHRADVLKAFDQLYDAQTP